MTPEIPVNDRPRRAVVHTLGCRLNQTESQLMRDRLAERGYRLVPFGADLLYIGVGPD